MNIIFIGVDDYFLDKIKKSIKKKINFYCYKDFKAVKKNHKIEIKADHLVLNFNIPLANMFLVLDLATHYSNFYFLLENNDFKKIEDFDFYSSTILNRFNIRFSKYSDFPNLLNNEIFKLERQNLPNEILIYSNKEFHLLDVNFITSIVSLGDYVKVHLENKTLIVHSSLKNIKAKLPENFVRTHRSAIVNLNFIKETNGRSVKLKDNKAIQVSRSGKKKLIDCLKRKYNLKKNVSALFSYNK